MVVGLLAGLLFLVGVAIMVGPALRRVIGIGRPRSRRLTPMRRPGRSSSSSSSSPTELHPTTVKALAATARLLAMLKEHSLERHATALRMAGKRLQVDEAAGIMAMRQVLRHLRSVRLDDESDHKIF